MYNMEISSQTMCYFEVTSSLEDIYASSNGKSGDRQFSMTGEKMDGNNYLQCLESKMMFSYRKEKGHFSTATTLPTTINTIGIGSVERKGNYLSALTVGKGKTNSWIVDSEASDHMTRDVNLFCHSNTCYENLAVKISNR